MYFKRCMLLVIAAMFFCMDASAQQFVFKNYSVDEGLPSSETYCALQDADGYMWFGTDRGVVKFDGYNFQVYTTQNGLARNTVFAIYQDHKKRLWFRSHSNQLVYMQNNKIYPHPANDLLNKNFPTDVIHYFQIDAADTIWISLEEKLVRISPDNKVTIVGKNDGPFKEIFHNNILTRNSKQGLKNYSMYNYAADTFLSINGRHDHTVEVFKQDGFSKIFNLPYEPICYFKGKNGKIWIGTKSRGIYCYNDLTFTKPYLHLLEDITITSIFQDREDNIWLTTLEDGIYLLRSTNMLSFPNKQFFDKNKCHIIANDGKDIWIGTEKGNVYRIDANKSIFDEMHIWNIVNSLVPDKNGKLWLGSPAGNYILEENKIQKLSFSGKHMTRMHF